MSSSVAEMRMKPIEAEIGRRTFDGTLTMDGVDRLEREHEQLRVQVKSLKRARQFAGSADSAEGAHLSANTTDAGVGGALGTVGDAVGSMMAYFTELIKRRRTEPEDDTISHLVTGGVGADGDITGTLSVLAFTFTMVTGGNDTTTGMLGGSMPLLHQRPDQRRLLADNPELIPDAVEELLRLTSPVQGLARTTTRDVTIGDTTVPAGHRVLLLYASANRDERQYGPNAGELDVRRCPRNILTFSHGAHHCLGAAAARMQSRVALTELLARCPDFEIDESAIVWAGGSYVRRPLSVPFTVRS